MSLLVAEGIPELKAHEYQRMFNQHQITKDIVGQLTHADLKDMAIPIGHVLRMEAAFKKMKMDACFD